MKLLPRLIKTTILLCLGKTVGEDEEEHTIKNGMKEVEVELWVGVGLCIHEYGDELRDKWRITHVNSGLSVLRHIKSRQEAIYYLLKVKEWETMEGITVDWTMTEDRLRSVYFGKELREMILGLQKEISGVVR